MFFVCLFVCLLVFIQHLYNITKAKAKSVLLTNVSLSIWKTDIFYYMKLCVICNLTVSMLVFVVKTVTSREACLFTVKQNKCTITQFRNKCYIAIFKIYNS